MSESRAREARAVRKKDEAAGESECEMSAMRRGLAAARARLEIEAGRREQATGGAGGGSANEMMSQPGLAASASLSPPQGKAAGAARPASGGSVQGGRQRRDASGTCPPCGGAVAAVK